MTPIPSLEKMRVYFQEGHTQSYAWRLQQLKALKKSILKHEEDLYTALASDLKKNREETWVTETGMVIAELSTAIQHLKRWMSAQPVPTNLLNFPSSSSVRREPLGVVLIIGPWNYPFQLLINPLIGAIAAGNCVVIKPSEFAPATAEVIRKIVTEIYPPEYVLFTDGDGAAVIPAMMQGFRFDHVFFTGSTSVGRLIYKMAADQLTPVTLELGGKSPCVVEADADMKVSAKRIVMTKFSNCGQMCVAPDYILVDASVADRFLEELKNTIRKFYGDNPAEDYNYGKMINEKQFDRVMSYMNDGLLYCGGESDKSKLYIAPTILTAVKPDSGLMRDEIFGPLLPVIAYKTKEEALAIVKQHPNPLSMYVFSRSRKKADEWIEAIPAGGTCVNNCSWHLTNHHLPFGGRGFSGTGMYHGKFSFDVFSHARAIMRTPLWFNPAIKFPPLKGRLGLFKKIIR